MKTQVWTVYKLVDPRDGSVGYVGCTSASITKRLKRHILDTRNRPNAAPVKAAWIRGLLCEGIEPLIISLEIVAGNCWENRESYWIKEMRDAGHSLANRTDGGTGSKGYRPSAETKGKISESETGKVISAEVRQKLSQLRKAFPRQKIDAISRMLHSASAIAKSNQSKRWLGPRCRSGFKGVCENKDGIVAKIILKTGKEIYLGTFHTLETAAYERDKAMWLEYGPDCYLNFPERFVPVG